jgi:mono/diheme cytochrome c family protein
MIRRILTHKRAAGAPRRHLAAFVLGAGLIGLTQAVLAAPDDQAALVEKGRQLAVAADCMACHTAVGKGQPFAGGYGIESPMGTIYSTNITPSKTAGIGNYTEAQFASALREGVRADGAHLYPAMPYTSYTGLSDDDVHALYMYFMHGIAAVDTPAPATQLPFPFSLRAAMIGWNLLFLKDRRFVADPSKSVQWNRGAYLTNVLGHCSACHTPRNALMAEDYARDLSGAQVGPWYAPNITADKISGIGAWTDAELVQYLKTGHAVGKNQAAGGMAEAVQNSLQYLSNDDLQAIVVYLKSTPPIRDENEHKPAFEYGTASSQEVSLRGAEPQTANGTLKSGAVLFSAYCASCHRADGAGGANQAYPSLVRNTATGSLNPSNLVAAILYGVNREAGGQQVLMPSFGDGSYVQPLTDQQIASIANHVLTQFGNADAHVTEADVAIARSGGPKPFLARIQPAILPGMGIVVLLILVLIAVYTVRRRARK